VDFEVECPYCGEWQTIFIDPSGGESQTYVEDCQVCCQPNVLRIEVDPDSLEATIESEEES